MKKLTTKELKRVKKFHSKQAKFHLKQVEKCEEELKKRDRKSQMIGFRF